MNARTKLSHRIQFSSILAIVAILLSTSLGLSGSVAYAQGVLPPTPASGDGTKTDYLTIETTTMADGTSITDTIIDGSPVPPTGFDAQRAAVMMTSAAAKILPVPAFTWLYGCSAVSGAMIAGYYDRNGYPKIYTGPTNSGVMPLTDASWPHWTDSTGGWYPNNPLVASHKGVDGNITRGSLDDYWVGYNTTVQDPVITNGWTSHTWGTAIGDYMKTSQSGYSNTDGSTHFYTFWGSAAKFTCADMATYGVSTKDGTFGRKQFYKARGYTVKDCYNQSTDNRVAGGFSLTNYRAEIDANRPVFLNLAGHSVVGVGYDGASNAIYIHDTWDADTHSMPWGGSYSGMPLLSVSVVNLVPLTLGVPTPVSPTGTISNTTPTFTWSKVTGATQYQFSVFTGSTRNYTKIVSAGVCGATNCSKTPAHILGLGAHTWKVRAYVGGVWKVYSALQSFSISAP